MCRLVAYLGPEIPIERIVILPKHSLLEQSQHATEAKLAVNGDGFGIAWYNDQEHPGLYKDVLPAWSDGNLCDFCRMVETRLFMAHVRASTVGETSRVNCHPFSYKKWSFMHNGQVGDFTRIKRQIEETLPDEFYNARRGTTDSEMLFMMLLANGLDKNPIDAINKTITALEKIQGRLSTPNRTSVVFTDGQTIYAFRYTSDHRIPSLYYGDKLESGGVAIASEPIDGIASNWTAIKDRHIAVLTDTAFKVIPLAAKV